MCKDQIILKEKKINNATDSTKNRVILLQCL